MTRRSPRRVVDGRYRVLQPRSAAAAWPTSTCAEDLQLGRQVALKVAATGRFAEDGEFVERFRREASSAARRCSTRNIVGVYDRGEYDGTYYIAMEYLDGRSLKDDRPRRRRRSPASARST